MSLWPEGVRCCAVLSFDLDADLEQYVKTV